MKFLKSSIKNLLFLGANQIGAHRYSSGNKLWILMYHRILPKTDSRFSWEEPGMVVTPETFEMHLGVIKKHFDVVRLSEWVESHQHGQKLPAKACAITFDDGWADNLEFALPLLKAEALPATMFIVADKIGTDFHFWPNIVSALLLSGSLSKLIQDDVFKYAYAAAGKVTDTGDYYGRFIWHLKNKFTDKQVNDALIRVNWRDLVNIEMPPSILNHDQLLQITSSGLFELGSHTCTHSRLNDSLDQQEVDYEIIQSRKKVELFSGKPASLFCYPSGDFTTSALDGVEKTYSAAVTTQQGIVNAARLNYHRLPRIRLHDDISSTPGLFGARLSGFF